MNIILIIVGSIAGLCCGYFLAKFVQRKKVGEYASIGQKILDDAKKEADVLKREASVQAKDTVLQARNELEQEIKARRAEIQNAEKRLSQKESNLDKKADLHRQEGRRAVKRENEVFPAKRDSLTARSGSMTSWSTSRGRDWRRYQG